MDAKDKAKASARANSKATDLRFVMQDLAKYADAVHDPGHQDMADYANDLMTLLSNHRDSMAYAMVEAVYQELRDLLAIYRNSTELETVSETRRVALCLWQEVNERTLFTNRTTGDLFRTHGSVWPDDIN